MHEALVSRGGFYQVREILEAGRREDEAKLEVSRNKQYGRCDVAIGISEKKLAPIVLNAIQTQFALFADFEEVAGRLKDTGIQTKRQIELQQEMLEVSNQLSGYGYMKDPDEKWKIIPNPDTAPVVQKIFDLALDGKTPA